MKVCVEAPPVMSRAMFRVADALRAHAPAGVQCVKTGIESDLQVLHVIGMEGMPDAISKSPEYAVLQYCYRSANGSPEQWNEVWKNARMVWSYYGDLPVPEGTNFLHSPLGVDTSVFRWNPAPRCRAVVTTGFVSGPCAEAIEEVAVAALRSGFEVVHIGPTDVVGMNPRISRHKDWNALGGISDARLAEIYQNAMWVSGLRHVEGFELPALEGLACGARPILFERPDMRQWYDGMADFIPECHGDELIQHLLELFKSRPVTVDPAVYDIISHELSWDCFAKTFWKELGV